MIQLRPELSLLDIDNMSWRGQDMIDGGIDTNHTLVGVMHELRIHPHRRII